MTDPAPKPSPTHNRRRFLALVGISAASAPLAVKAAEDALAADMTTLGTDKTLASGTPAVNEMWGGENSKERLRAKSWLHAGGKMPDHVAENMRKQANYVDHLDPDIACKKSWSLVAKVNEQRQRNYTRLIEKESKVGWFEEAQKAFEQATGFKWPY